MTSSRNSSLNAVRAQLALFLAGGDYESLWQAIEEATATVDTDVEISDDERDWFDELYDAVYMAEEDPVDRKSTEAGIIGAAELREQIRAMRLDQLGISGN